MTSDRTFTTRELPAITSPSIDIYVSYRCGLRCSHCFLGDLLNTNQEMTPANVASIIRNAHTWGCKEITFLGGEPTLYKSLPELILLADQHQLRTRIVSNGQAGFKRFIENERMRATHICLSVDGSSSQTHDRIRGKGTFAALIRNADTARARGFSLSGIFSVSRQNHEETEEVLRLCAQLGFTYLNIHYVSSRGSADSASALSPVEWLKVCERIQATAKLLPEIEIRYERTFVDKTDVKADCAVKDGSNLMFLPDGRVFSCMMFIDIPGAHSFEWKAGQLTRTLHQQTEHKIVDSNKHSGCPALALVNPEVVSTLGSSKCVECIYAKHHLNPK